MANRQTQKLLLVVVVVVKYSRFTLFHTTHTYRKYRNLPRIVHGDIDGSRRFEPLKGIFFSKYDYQCVGENDNAKSFKKVHLSGCDLMYMSI